VEKFKTKKRIVQGDNVINPWYNQLWSGSSLVIKGLFGLYYDERERSDFDLPEKRDEEEKDSLNKKLIHSFANELSLKSLDYYIKSFDLYDRILKKIDKGELAVPFEFTKRKIRTFLEINKVLRGYYNEIKEELKDLGSDEEPSMNVLKPFIELWSLQHLMFVHKTSDVYKWKELLGRTKALFIKSETEDVKIIKSYEEVLKKILNDELEVPNELKGDDLLTVIKYNDKLIKYLKSTITESDEELNITWPLADGNKKTAKDFITEDYKLPLEDKIEDALYIIKDIKEDRSDVSTIMNEMEGRIKDYDSNYQLFKLSKYHMKRIKRYMFKKMLKALYATKDAYDIEAEVYKKLLEMQNKMDNEDLLRLPKSIRPGIPKKRIECVKKCESTLNYENDYYKEWLGVLDAAVGLETSLNVFYYKRLFRNIKDPLKGQMIIQQMKSYREIGGQYVTEKYNLIKELNELENKTT
jgi:hypothetical protein